MNVWTIERSNHSLRWQAYGEGKAPLIFIHGLGCASSNDYPPVVGSKDYGSIPSVLVDLPGAGSSNAPADARFDSNDQVHVLKQWMEDITLSGARLFGHSAGAFIALKLARELSSPPLQLILCTPGLNTFGTAMLEEIAAMSEDAFVEYGFLELLRKLEQDKNNDAWLVPFQRCSPRAIWQWAGASLRDNASPWLAELEALDIDKSVILPGTADQVEIDTFLAAGCRVELVPESGHMLAYTNPNGLAGAIARLLVR